MRAADDGLFIHTRLCTVLHWLSSRPLATRSVVRRPVKLAVCFTQLVLFFFLRERPTTDRTRNNCCSLLCRRRRRRISLEIIIIRVRETTGTIVFPRAAVRPPRPETFGAAARNLGNEVVDVIYTRVHVT